MKYAVVDIETTGGSAKLHAITEIAIIQMEDDVVVDRYETLINPNMPIPPKIAALTGISNEMVANAPAFHEVAKEIWTRTHEHVFVAHNVNFDYHFIREQFSRLGAIWRPKRLCTVRLSRKVFPSFYSYSLGKIAEQLGEKIESRHRAMGDAQFTAKLFQRILMNDTQDIITFSLNQRSKESSLPPMLNRKQFDALPTSQGVYIFKGSGGKILYIGKANDLKKRVTEHFQGNTHTGYKNRFVEKIEDLEWITTPNELIALLTEATLIKKHWPPYNSLMKRVSLNWGIYHYTDQLGFMRFHIGRVGKWDRPVMSFRLRNEARKLLETLCREHRLCARFCGLQDLSGRCIHEFHGPCEGACVGEEAAESYNQRFSEAYERLVRAGRTMLIKGKGFHDDECSIILIEKGRYKGHGLVPASLANTDLNALKSFIATGYDDQDIQALIMSNLYRFPEEYEVVYF